MKIESKWAGFVFVTILTTFAFLGGCSTVDARKLHFSSTVIDTHDDTTQIMLDADFNLGERHNRYSVDIPRMKEGGLDAVFFSIWISGKITGEEAVKQANEQIDTVLDAAKRHSSHLKLATTAEQIESTVKQGKIAVLMGVEGGHMLNSDLEVLRSFAKKGVRYLTLTHSVDTDFADSSTGDKKNNGLTAFGRDVIHEMNKLGMIVDVSHVSDKTFYDVLAISKAPIFASHSSCRALNDHPRNMTDEMMQAMAKSGGVIQINFLDTYISQELKDAKKVKKEFVDELWERVKKKCKDLKGCHMDAYAQFIYQAQDAGQLPKVDWRLIVDHIDHAVKVAGVDHVGLGSDFDGAVMPNGMEDVSKLPKITEELVNRGYSEADIKKILGENTLRLLKDVEKVSKVLTSIESH